MMEQELIATNEIDKDALMHHGIKGQKWGIQNGPPYPLNRGDTNRKNILKEEKMIKKFSTKNLKKSKSANLDKWGKDEDHNVLYIAGYSGSGKSTTAIGLADIGDKIIHLDGYTESKNDSITNKDFNSYLDKEVPNWKKIQQATINGEGGSMKRFSKEYWETVDKFRDAVENYGRSEYKNGHKVIVEGVQIADNWLTDDGGHNYYRDRPIIILSTSRFRSIRRAFSRDGRFLGLRELSNAIDLWSMASIRLNDLATTVDAERSKQLVLNFLEKRR